MLGSTHEHSYLNSGTLFLSVLLQGKLYKNSLENSLSPTQQFMDRNNTLIMPPEWTSTWTTCFLPATSKISLWRRLDQLHMFCTFVEYIFLLLSVFKAHR